MTNQSRMYRVFLISAVSVFLALGTLHGGAALAAGGYEIEGDLDSDSEVDLHDLREMSEIWLLGADVNEPVIVDVNEPVIADVNLTSAGGIFELPGGLVIDAPPGAVSENTLFQIRLIDANEVEPYLDIGSMRKSFMGGFEIISDGIVFNIPILVRFPIEPLHDPNSLPHIFYLNKDDGTLIPDLPEIEDTVLPEQASYSMLAAAPADSGYMYDPRDAIAEFMISITPPERKSQMLIELYDVLGHSDCLANPCRCLRQFVTSHAADFESANKCSMVSESGSIQFPDCEGQPIEGWSMKHESIQIAYTLSPDTRSILCDGSLTMTVDIFGIDGKRRENHEVKVTSSRPDLLEVTSFIGNMFLLERVGEDTGVANVVIDAGCEITRTVPIQVGCEIPNVAGQWSVSGRETWWGCLNYEDDGTYVFSLSVEFSQAGSTFTGTISYRQEYEDYIETYTENYHGEITPNCEITDRCAYKVSGSTNYTETYFYFEGDEPYTHVTKGIDTFTGDYSEGVMRLTTLGSDTSGDTCQTFGTMILTR
jgi:hypothetical protein